MKQTLQQLQPLKMAKASNNILFALGLINLSTGILIILWNTKYYLNTNYYAIPLIILGTLTLILTNKISTKIEQKNRHEEENTKKRTPDEINTWLKTLLKTYETNRTIPGINKKILNQEEATTKTLEQYNDINEYLYNEHPTKEPIIGTNG